MRFKREKKCQNAVTICLIFFFDKPSVFLRNRIKLPLVIINIYYVCFDSFSYQNFVVLLSTNFGRLNKYQLIPNYINSEKSEKKNVLRATKGDLFMKFDGKIASIRKCKKYYGAPTSCRRIELTVNTLPYQHCDVFFPLLSFFLPFHSRTLWLLWKIVKLPISIYTYLRLCAKRIRRPEKPKWKEIGINEIDSTRIQLYCQYWETVNWKHWDYFVSVGGIFSRLFCLFCLFRRAKHSPSTWI